MSNTENRGENELRCSECGGIIQKNELALGSIWEIPGGMEKLRNKMNSQCRCRTGKKTERKGEKNGEAK